MKQILKRITFLTLSLMVLGLIGLLASTLDGSWGSVVISPLLVILYVLFTILGNIVYRETVKDNDTILPLFLGTGIISIFYKRIYYMDIGYLWCKFDHKNDTVTVYEQKWFILEKKFESYYYDDLELTKEEIKTKIEKVYKSEIADKNDRKKRKESLRNWNGSVDKASNRDLRLNKILKK